MKLEEVNRRTKEAVDFLVAALESGHSEVLTAYLSAMAKFYTYSFGNILLIARQKPEATNVAGIRTWNSLGRFVKRGEKGIFIIFIFLHVPSVPILWVLGTRQERGSLGCHLLLELFQQSDVCVGIERRFCVIHVFS